MNTAILLTGTPITELPTRPIKAGKLEVIFDAGSLRKITWDGVEIIRAILFLVRTPGWGTPDAEISELVIDQTDDNFSISYKAQYGKQDGVTVAIYLIGHSAGKLHAKAEISTKIPFLTNRTGFVVLHPLDGFAGTITKVESSSGQISELTIPALISPGQPAMDLQAITHYPVQNLEVKTHFEGDIFEMEDHRNWSDASFKTYSRPIGLPYPYTLEPDAPLTQRIDITIKESGALGQPVSIVQVPPISNQLMPEYALPLDKVSDAQEALSWTHPIKSIGFNWILLSYDTSTESLNSNFDPLAELLETTGAKLEVQVVLNSISNDEADDALESLSERFAASAINVSCISAFAKIDEQSFQPGEARPPHPAEAFLASSLEKHFPSAKRIGGTPAFFTELNRKRPDPALWQGLSFATTPTVHAADDVSVMETLQSLPHILNSANVLANDLPLLVGPIGIGARLNPYGSGPNINDPQTREGMAAHDPRQRGLFAAAWIVGYLAQIASFAPQRFAFGAPTGSFGLISSAQSIQRVYWDDLPDGAVYPLYHVASWLAKAAGSKLLAATTENNIATVMWDKNGKRHALLANLTASALPLPMIKLCNPVSSILNANNIELFATYLDKAEPHPQILPETIDPYAVIYLVEGDKAK